ncbi:MAG: hypothetical protein JSW60_06630 [Thermoplasmatales archaeon]|nr:MAG: hypothetical protein JSW60_06630 [Thermoplasmatales archaeon]
MNIKKGLAVAVILLFIGVTFVPSIYANVSRASIDSDLVEFTTEVCGFNGGKRTVKLTQEESGEVEALFDSIREQLNASETREEAEEIFKEAVVELDKYGLLGGLSVEQAQRLVTGGYQNPRMMKIIENMISRSQEDNNSNFFCLVTGRTDETLFVSPRMRFIYPFVRHWLFDGPHPILDLIFKFANDNVKFMVLLFIVFLAVILTYWSNDVLKLYQRNPLPRRCMIYLGKGLSGGIPASGWINTYGFNGKVGWEGEFYGNLPWGCFTYAKQYPAVDGFRGFQLYIDKFEETHFYLGSARWVKIGDNPPKI